MSNTEYNFYKFDINQRLFLNVAANSSETLDYTPPDGEVLIIVRAGGNSADNPDTNICVVWDPGGGSQEIIFSTYHDSVHDNIHKDFTGDGTKELRIVLTNDLSESSYLGGFVQGERVPS